MNIGEKWRGGGNRVRSLIHLSDFILGLNLFLVVFTPASYFSPSPLVCHFCVKPRLCTGFSFLPYIFSFWRLVLCIVSSVYLGCFHLYFVYTFWFTRYNRYLFGSACTVILVLALLVLFLVFFRTSRHLQGSTWGLVEYP